MAATDISGVKNIGATVVEVGNATDKIVVVVKVIGLGIVVVEGFVLTTGTVVVVVVVVPLDGCGIVVVVVVEAGATGVRLIAASVDGLPAPLLEIRTSIEYVVPLTSEPIVKLPAVVRPVLTHDPPLTLYSIPLTTEPLVTTEVTVPRNISSPATRLTERVAA